MFAVVVLAITLAVAFQVAGTAPLLGHEMRVSASDILLPILVAVAIFRVSVGRSGYVTWRVKGFYFWLAALSTWLVVSLFIGYLHMDAWFSWALINKIVGRYVLLAYLALGGWIALEGTRVRDLFLRSFFVMAWLTAAYAIVFQALSRFGAAPELPFEIIRPEGFLGNPNAYGYFLAVAVSIQMPFLRFGRLFTPTVHAFGLAALVATIVLTGSRAAWIGAGAGFIALLALRMVNRRTVIALSIAAALSAFLIWGIDEAVRLGGATSHTYFLNQPILSGEDYGFQLRLELTLKAWETWIENPVLGIGLGSFLWDQTQAAAPDPAVVHNSLLWLLAETGSVGALLFLGFFGVCIAALAKAQALRPIDPLHAGMLAAMATFAGASIGHELMYQRYWWFFLGLALAVTPHDPNGVRSDERDARSPELGSEPGSLRE